MNTPSDPHACYAPNDGARPAAAPDPLPLTRPLLEEALAAKPALAALSRVGK